MHRRADGDDTASSWAPIALAGLRMSCSANRRPFHRSASTRGPTAPTTTHRLADVHDTASRAFPGVPTGLPGVGWITQVVPFQRSASAPAPVSPTAVHAVADVHDTPAMKPSSSGSGTVRTVHVAPSRLS